MKKSAVIFLLVSVLFTLSFNGCDKDDGVSSGGLAGVYNLVSLLDKATGQSFIAGQPTDFMGMAITISATLTLTETTYQMIITSVASYMGQSETQTDTDHGTYTTSGNTITTTDTEGEINAMTYTLNGNELTLEDEESRLVFNRQ